MARTSADSVHQAGGLAHRARRPLSRRVGAHILEEIRHILPATIYFFLGFNLVLLTKKLMLEQYLIQFSGFFIASGAALIVGKVVLVVDKMPFLRRYDYAPLAKPILFKTLVYTFFVFLARLLEAFIHYLVAGGAVTGFGHHLLAEFSWPTSSAFSSGFSSCSSAMSQAARSIISWGTASSPRSCSRGPPRS